MLRQAEILDILSPFLLLLNLKLPSMAQLSGVLVHEVLPLAEPREKQSAAPRPSDAPRVDIYGQWVAELSFFGRRTAPAS